jgi:hypothetical protein
MLSGSGSNERNRKQTDSAEDVQTEKKRRFETSSMWLRTTTERSRRKEPGTHHQKAKDAVHSLIKDFTNSCQRARDGLRRSPFGHCQSHYLNFEI